MATEVEIKLPIRSALQIIPPLKNQGFVPEGEYTERDTYFDNDLQQIRRGGQALRVRRIHRHDTGEESCVITFKGKKLDSVSMTREELETSVGDGDVALQLFAALGYHPVEPQVVKYRREFICGDMHACVDQVEGLGDFLELEIVTDGEREAALAKIEAMLGTLGYSMADTVTTSYLSQLMRRL